MLTLVALLAVGCSDDGEATAADSRPPDGRLPDSAPSPDGSAGSPDMPRPDLSVMDWGALVDSAPKSLSVLFIGNSYTQANNLPQLVAGIAKASGKAPAISVDSELQGGATLAMHWQNSAVQTKINKGTFTHMVFQGQSVEPQYNPTQFGAAAKKLADAAKKKNAKPVWFETWARAPGHAYYNTSYSGGSPAVMQKDLRLAYGSVAKATGGLYAPVGDAWEASLKAHKTIKLHTGDGSHPNEYGSYLAACVFYSLLSGRSAEGLGGVPSGVAKADAAKLAKIAWAAVQKGAP